MSNAGERARRLQAAARFQPARIELLLIADAPPAADRYFYFTDVANYDSLFRNVVWHTLGIAPSRANKADLLGRLRDAGVFLIDLCLDPIFEARERRTCVDDLISRVSDLSPQHIILIKVTTFDTAFDSLKKAGLPVVNKSIPFPGSGHQIEFAEAFGSALEAIEWRKPEPRS